MKKRICLKENAAKSNLTLQYTVTDLTLTQVCANLNPSNYLITSSFGKIACISPGTVGLSGVEVL